ncbi:MAG: hypothetical protein S4CHLAM102_05800 [Chlamydiia bacterium]|nr:hypothetical protein [Chlamydiia bacterium]
MDFAEIRTGALNPSLQQVQSTNGFRFHEADARYISLSESLIRYINDFRDCVVQYALSNKQITLIPLAQIGAGLATLLVIPVSFCETLYRSGGIALTYIFPKNGALARNLAKYQATRAFFRTISAFASIFPTIYFNATHPYHSSHNEVRQHLHKEYVNPLLKKIVKEKVKSAAGEKAAAVYKKAVGVAGGAVGLVGAGVNWIKRKWNKETPPIPPAPALINAPPPPPMNLLSMARPPETPPKRDWRILQAYNAGKDKVGRFAQAIYGAYRRAREV